LLSITTVTVNGTTEAGETRYRPFGAERYSSGQTLTSYQYTGQRAEAGLGLYYYGARWYDPALGRFIQPDTIVPNPGDAQSFDRYAYVLNNPLKYQDPDGHRPCMATAGKCSQAVALSNHAADQLANHLSDLQVDWTDVPVNVRAALQEEGIHEGIYNDLGPGATAQTGWRDPATLIASLYGGVRLAWRLPALLFPCADDGCETEYRTYEMAVRRVGVSLQKMGGVVGDSLRHAKGFHIDTSVPGAELGLRPGQNSTIVIRTLGETKVNPSDYINSVSTLLSQQQDKVLAQLNGIISTHPNTWVAQEAQQLIDIINRGNYKIIAQ